MFKFQLGEKLHKTISEVEQISGAELRQWMAYFSLQDEDYRKGIEKKAEAIRLEQMSDEDRAAHNKSFWDKFDNITAKKGKK